MSTPTDNLEDTIISLASAIEESSEGEAEKLVHILNLKSGDRIKVQWSGEDSREELNYLGASGQWLLCSPSGNTIPIAFSAHQCEFVARAEMESDEAGDAT